MEEDRIFQLEEEKEQLASSLFSLTTRFAQIQFRLHQITEAPPNEKDLLLKELEEFAHKGCVDQQIVRQNSEIESSDDDTKKSMTQELREKHEIIINELKAQLNDFESFAFKQVCNEVFPQSVQLEKQQALLEQLTRKLNLQVNEEDFAHTSVDVLKSRVDEAVAEIVNPAKIKGKLVDHLQTQIQDLERFVEFLQESEGKSYMGCLALHMFTIYGDLVPQTPTNCSDSHHITLISISLADGKSSGSIPNPTSKKPQHKQSERRQALALVRRALTLIQMFSITQFGCGGRSQPEETIVDTKSLIDHLKQAVNHVRSLENFVTFHINVVKTFHIYEGFELMWVECLLRLMSMEVEFTSKSICKNPLNMLSKFVNISLQPYVNLSIFNMLWASHLSSFQFHWSMSTAKESRGCDGESETETSSLSSYEDGDGDRLNLVADELTQVEQPQKVTKQCLNDKQPMHPWELFLEYYELKNGPELARSPSRMLTRSFNLDDLVANGDTSRSKIAKHSLLEAIHLVVKDHDPLKRGYDAMLKALICLGLNAGRLSRWIRLISRVPSIISKHYSDASYVARTGMEGVITVLSKLDPITFDLPVDVAVRPFKNM
uniref:RUN domain-containing protein n=1 Tax=Ciona savignyi TaxID=51511 RepID=H2ZER3_CIOSA